MGIDAKERAAEPSYRAAGASERGLGKKRSTAARALDRGVQAKNGGTPPRARAAAQQPSLPALSAAQQATLRERESFLERMTRHLRRVARGVGSAEARRDLAGLEHQFRAIMRRSPQGITNAADRRRAIRLLDAGRQRARSAWSSEPFWHALYADPAARADLDNARRRGLIRLTDGMIERGNAPLGITFEPSGRRVLTTYSSLNIDHAVPLERVPFRPWDSDNLRVTSGPFNQRFLNRWSGSVIFPMEARRATNEVEDFVQANGLSRRQRRAFARLESRRRAARALGIVAPLVLLAGASARAQVYSRIAQDIRSRRHGTPPTRSIQRGGVDALNLQQGLDRVFLDRTPPETNSVRRSELVVAFEDWVNEALTEDTFDTLLQRSRDIRNVTARNRELFSILDDAVLVLDRLRDGRALVEGWLAPSDDYLESAQTLDRVQAVREDVLEAELQSWGIDPEDAVTIAFDSVRLAADYRGYVADLERLRDLIAEAARVFEGRRRKVLTALAP